MINKNGEVERLVPYDLQVPVEDYVQGSIDGVVNLLKDGEPCLHPGCLSHVTHPCDGCGRVAGHPQKK